jgi:hypothetical protein
LYSTELNVKAIGSGGTQLFEFIKTQLTRTIRLRRYPPLSQHTQASRLGVRCRL